MSSPYNSYKYFYYSILQIFRKISKSLQLDLNFLLDPPKSYSPISIQAHFQFFEFHLAIITLPLPFLKHFLNFQPSRKVLPANLKNKAATFNYQFISDQTIFHQNITFEMAQAIGYVTVMDTRKGNLAVLLNMYSLN